jgi:ribose/xylose/arabinose/galactoside ABC-type transport system permease subunit
MKRPGSLHLSRRAVNNLILLGLLIALVLFFTSMNPRFFSVRNFVNLTRQVLPLVLMGCAMTFVINSGAIDLSVAGLMALSAVLFATFVTWGVGVWVALLMVILLGLLLGAINTFIVSGLKIPSIMATLATSIMSVGLAYIICRSIPVRDGRMKPIFEINSKIFFNNSIPLALFIILAVVAAFLFLEKRTVLGKYAISLGGNENAAILSGISVPRMRLIFFCLTGAMAAFSGVWQVARIGSGDPTIGTGMEFAVIAGCILGGVNIKGGDGTITGMLLGTIILALLTNGMNMMGINAFYQQVATGIVLLVAVLITFAVPYVRTRMTAGRYARAAEYTPRAG